MSRVVTLLVLSCLYFLCTSPRAEHPTKEPPLPTWTSAANVERVDGKCTLPNRSEVTFTSYRRDGLMGSMLFVVTAAMNKVKIFQFEGSASDYQLGTTTLSIKTKTGPWRAYAFGVPGDIKKAQSEFLSTLGASAEEFIACLNQI